MVGGFVVDGMLGKLCRWLRMLGYDVVYLGRRGSDDDLIRLALEQSKTLLTRDFLLYRKALKMGVKAVYIDSGILEEQLKQVALNCGIKLSIPLDNSRCPICNHPLRMCLKEDVESKIPQKVAESSMIFWVCDGCGKVYWIGRHWRDIMAKLRRVQLEVEGKGKSYL
ncbi:MAG: Mut7-C RNAse domain-containing protein [archaeon GBS-70-058]|nr:Mut7-C RNAse domain-containing protein [Candidatus Culexarchaeum nevadense]